VGEITNQKAGKLAKRRGILDLWGNEVAMAPQSKEKRKKKKKREYKA